MNDIHPTPFKAPWPARSLMAGALLLGLLAACGQEPDDGPIKSAADSGQADASGVDAQVPEEAEAGSPDAGAPADAGDSADSGAPGEGDAGLEDAAVDAGAEDAGPEDAAVDAGPEDAGAEPENPTLAVVFSDYRSSQVGLLNRDGIIEASLISSAGGGLNTALSGDVVLARDSGEDASRLTVIDRTNSVLTVLDTEARAVLGQLRVSTGSFSANPHDVAVIDAHHAWVSRHNPNMTPGACAADFLACGDDLIEYDPSTLELTGRRITVEGGSQDGEQLYGTPDSLVQLGDTLVVGMVYFNHQSPPVFGPGRVSLVDLSAESPQAQVLEISDSAVNCGVLRKASEDSVLISCMGAWVGASLDARASGGVYKLTLTEPPTVTPLWEPRSDDMTPAVQNAEPIGDGDAFMAVADKSLYLISPSDAAETPIVPYSGPFWPAYSIDYDAPTQVSYYSYSLEALRGVYYREADGTSARIHRSHRQGMPPTDLRVLRP